MRITKGTPPVRGAGRTNSFTREEAESLGLRALTFLASEDERIQRFLQLTGLDPRDLPDLAPRSDFLLAVLDHIASDEPLLMECSRELQLRPEEFSIARRALGGGDMG
ncbi:MAG: DUF3572 domain-containing protein [Methylocystis sp.]|jgi:hypothetical protein